MVKPLPMKFRIKYYGSFTAKRLREQLTEYRYRKKNGMSGSKLYFGLIFHDISDVRVVEKVLKGKE